MEYWQNVIKLANDNNLSVTEFSKRTGLAINYLTKIRKEKYKAPSKHTLYLICKAFNVNPQDVYEGADKDFLTHDKNKYIPAFWNQIIHPLVTEQHLSVTKLAELSGVSRVYLSALKNGQFPAPSPEVVIKLANHFKADPYDWLKWVSDNISLSHLRNEDIYDYEQPKRKNKK
ncbi:helix-turn-helix domain-containing protein [Apilactobacillus timberlakei]|uniref:helix-turn-helix domain-containing protein n=1 Tax=Apilactobacillus timberlakei TaxID=2008380 RepID=UPI0011262EB0|nr:helix-turn-helix domain-containing protein [Apilactobacillus timberlakei]TPR13008.1 helix-turn-helix domain-containing protein [Apilactobacillus timberlakei]